MIVTEEEAERIKRAVDCLLVAHGEWVAGRGVLDGMGMMIESALLDLPGGAPRLKLHPEFAKYRK